ncbi:hypothetical protein BHE74_00019705 [Ensete ventricosum]|nr:hypothetical protein BHE74_00019705 [Ensete ventricosum]
MLGSGCHFDAGSSTDLAELSCKIRPFLGWWVPGEVSPTIKLELFRRVKFGVSCSDVSQLLRRGREENRKGRPKMQLIVYVPPLPPIRREPQKTIGVLP